MKETVEIKIGEKVMSVDATALFSLAVKGRAMLEDTAREALKRGDDILADVHREHIEKCRPVVDALAHYVCDLLMQGDKE